MSKAKPKKLTAKQKLFVEYYLQTWNAAQAAKAAGYKGSYATLRSIGSENLTKPNILAEIERRFKEIAMSSEEVMARLSGMARAFDVADYIEFRETYAINKDGDEYFTGYDMQVDLDRLQADGYSHLIKKVKSTSRGIEVEWHDQMAALVHLGKYHKLFIERHEHTGEDGGPIEFDLEEWQKKRQDRLDKVAALKVPEE